MSRSKIAVFVDVENLTQWLKQKGPEKLVTELSSTGHIIVRKAYGNWNNSSIQSYQQDLNRQGFELIHNFHPVSGKNSSDIQLTVDVMESALRLTDVDWFVLATGDSDFSPLFRRLREMGKEVIGVGPRSPLSESVKTSCSRYIFIDSPDDLANEKQKAIKLTLSTLRTFDGAAHCSALKNRLIGIDSAFNEKALGFSSFTDYLNSIDTLDVFQQGKVWQVKHRQTAKPKPSSKPEKPNKPEKPAKTPDAAPKLEEPEEIENPYQALVRKGGFPAIERNLIEQACRSISTKNPVCRDALPSIICRKNQGKLSIEQAKKIVTLLFKSQAFQAAGKNSSGDPLFTIRPDVSYIQRIDTTIVTRVLQHCQAKDKKIQDSRLAELLYGRYSNSEFSELKALVLARLPVKA